MNTLTFRTLSTFPDELQSQVRAHAYDDFDELVQQVALALLEAKSGDTLAKIFNRARSRVRRFTQNPAHYGGGLEYYNRQASGGNEPDDEPPAEGMKRRERVRMLAETRGVTLRRAQQIVRQQIDQWTMERQGDLFAENGSGEAK